MVRRSTLGAVVAGLGMGFGMLLVQVGIDRWLGHAQRTLLYSDIFIGIVTAIAVGFGLHHYEQKVDRDRARVRMIAEMNHHVRNALTAISLSVYAKNDPELENITRDAIQRIDWALREVLAHSENPTIHLAPRPILAEPRRSA